MNPHNSFETKNKQALCKKFLNKNEKKKHKQVFTRFNFWINKKNEIKLFRARFGDINKHGVCLSQVWHFLRPLFTLIKDLNINWQY